MRLCSKILPGFLFGYEHLVEVRLEGQLLTSSRSMSRSEDFLHQAIYMYLLFKIRPREFDLPAPSIKSCLCSLHRYNLIGASGEMLKHKFQGSSSILTTARIDSILLMSQRALERWPWSLYDSLQTALVYGPRVSHNMGIEDVAAASLRSVSIYTSIFWNPCYLRQNDCRYPLSSHKTL